MSAAIALRGVSKVFVVSHDKPALVRAVLPRLLRPRRVEAYEALRDVTLEIAAGTTVGIVGPNGAGKTTLLSVMAGITPPSAGTVCVRGRMVSLLTLGSGFHPELTGLENIFLNGAILGMRTREIRRKLESIVAFSGLDGFIDAPLQTYSTGMQLRLGFAVAIHADADVLLIDEVMTVGDQAFQAQCLEHLQRLKRSGKTLLLVSHGREILEQLADRAILLVRGQIIEDGPVDYVLQRYATLLPWWASTQQPLTPRARGAIEQQVERHDRAMIRGSWGQRRGTGEAEIEDVRFLDADGRALEDVSSGGPLTVAIRFTVLRAILDSHIGVAFFREDGTYCYGPNTRLDGLRLTRMEPGVYACRLEVDALRLMPGRYRLTIAVWDAEERRPYVLRDTTYPLEVTGAPGEGAVVLEHIWRALPARPGVDSTRAGVAGAGLLAQGPRGEQRWYRSGESLTFTIWMPQPPWPGAGVLRAECRGPRGELWWASRWSSLAAPSLIHGALRAAQLEFPRLSLLTGRYHWFIGWAGSNGSQAHRAPLTRTVEIVADRMDHGIVRLPHRWNVRRCQNLSLSTAPSIH